MAKIKINAKKIASVLDWSSDEGVFMPPQNSDVYAEFAAEANKEVRLEMLNQAKSFLQQ